MPTKQLSRLDRLAGNGKNSGGGLPLPPLFQVVMAELVDRGTLTVEELLSPVEQAIPNRARVNELYAKDGYKGLIEDVLNQLKSKRLAEDTDSIWKIGHKFQQGKTQTVISERNGKNHSLTVTVYSKEDRDKRSAASRDDRELRAMYNDLRNERTFSVRATFPRGRAKRVNLKLHPLARSIPQMSEQEFMDLGYNIKEQGVKVPIVLLDGQVLDGRHRVAIAAALQKPVRVELFEGDEEAARDLVVSLNLQRRSLNIPQRALIVQQLFLPQAEMEMRRQEEARLHENGSETPDRVQTAGRYETGDTNQEFRAVQVAAARSHGLASARTLQRMHPVREAPETQERIRRGEIGTATKARREALRELGQEGPADIPAASPRTAFTALGLVLYEAKRANEALGVNGLGHVEIDKYIGRIEEIRAALDMADQLIAKLDT